MYPRDITYCAIFMLIDPMQLVLVGILKSLGMQKEAFARSLIGQLAVGIPLAYLLGVRLGYSNPGLWIGLTIGNGFLAILYFGLLLKKDWGQAALDASTVIESYLSRSQDNLAGAWEQDEKRGWDAPDEDYRRIN